MALFSAAGGKWTNKKIETRTETGDEDLALAVGELRQDLDPGNIIHIFILPVKGSRWWKGAHISCMGSCHAPPSTPEWLSFVMLDEI